MSDEEDYFTGRNNSVRFSFDSMDESGTENYAKVDGLTDETFEKVLHIQPHGFYSSPKKGGHMLGVALGSRRDTMVVMGGEHPDHKPKKLGEGNTAFYNSTYDPKKDEGTIMKMVGDDITTTAKGKHSATVKEFHVVADGIELHITKDGFVVKAGNVTHTISKDGIATNNGTIKHDDHSIDKTHKHTNSGGIGLSGEPE